MNTIDHLFVIGVGGTGAKAVRAFTHLCAMGLGPKTVDIFLIDLDTNNGDLQLTQNTIEAYLKVKEKLGEDNNSSYFRSDINFLTPEPWSPLTFLDMSNNTLGGYLNYLATIKKYRSFEKLLFSTDELNVPLSSGCKAHPNIGSFLIAPIFQDMKFIDPLKKTLQKQNSGIFVFNSIFGGTGAAGGPVIIKGIDELFIDQEQSAEKTTMEGKFNRRPIGGSIFMPYFIIPESKDEDELLKIKSETFDYNAAGALPFYKDSVPANLIYILGDRYKFILDEYASGSTGQRNPAHMLEFFSALFALDFCRQKFDLTKKFPPKFYTISFGRNTDKEEKDDSGIYFEDLPDLTFENDVKLDRKLINFQIFDIFYKDFFQQSRGARTKDYVWLHNILKPNNIGLDNIFFEYINTYMEVYHEWMEQMHKNTAPLCLFNSRQSIELLLANKNLPPLKKLDHLHRHLNTTENGKAENTFINVINMFYNGINTYLDSKTKK